MHITACQSTWNGSKKSMYVVLCMSVWISGFVGILKALPTGSGRSVNHNHNYAKNLITLSKQTPRMSKTNGSMKCFRVARRLSDRQTAAVSLSRLSLSLDLFAQSDTGSFIYVQICSWAQQGWCACWISPFWALADYPSTPFGPNRPKPSCPDLLSLRLSLCSLVSHSQLPPLARRHHQPVSSCSTHHFSKNYYITHFMNNEPQRQREKERWGERDRE